MTDIKIVEKVKIFYPVFCNKCKKTGLHEKYKKDGWIIMPNYRCYCQSCYEATQ